MLILHRVLTLCLTPLIGYLRAYILINRRIPEEMTYLVFPYFYDFSLFLCLEPIYEISVSSFETHYLTELYFSAVLSSREYILEGAVKLVLSIPSRLSSDVYMRSLN